MAKVLQDGLDVTKGVGERLSCPLCQCKWVVEEGDSVEKSAHARQRGLATHVDQPDEVFVTPCPQCGHNTVIYQHY